MKSSFNLTWLRRTFFPVMTLLIAVGLCAVGHAGDRVKIAIWGDSRENLDSACENIASILLNDITDWDFMIHTGDFTSTGKVDSWKRSLAVPGISGLFKQGRFLMCTSNHDRDAAAFDEFTKGILPTNSADGSSHFFGFKFKNVHIVTCDPYFAKADVMQAWLDGYLKGVKEGEWVIGVWHCPSYADLTYKEALPESKAWLKSLYRHGGDFILNGHAHVYLRTKPLLPDGTVDEKNGMVHVINGVGGASWKSAQPYVEKTAFTPTTKSFAAITFLTIDDQTARLETIDARPGKKLAVIDSMTRKKNAEHFNSGANTGPNNQPEVTKPKRQPVPNE